MAEITRLSINLNEEAAAALREIAGRRNISITEAVRRAIAVWKFVEDETGKGNTIQVVDKKDNRVRELMLV